MSKVTHYTVGFGEGQNLNIRRYMLLLATKKNNYINNVLQ